MLNRVWWVCSWPDATKPAFLWSLVEVCHPSPVPAPDPLYTITTPGCSNQFAKLQQFPRVTSMGPPPGKLSENPVDPPADHRTLWWIAQMTSLVRMHCTQPFSRRLCLGPHQGVECFSISASPRRQLCRRECDWETLSCIHTQVGVLKCFVLNHLGSSTTRLWCYSACNPFKTSAKQKCDSRPRFSAASSIAIELLIELPTARGPLRYPKMITRRFLRF